MTPLMVQRPWGDAGGRGGSDGGRVGPTGWALGVALGMTLAAVASILAGCPAYSDWSGLTHARDLGFVSVNNRPGTLATCQWPLLNQTRADSGVIDCAPLGLSDPAWRDWDMEAVTWLGDDRFAFATEKTHPGCWNATGCALDQRVVFFRVEMPRTPLSRAIHDGCPDVHYSLQPDDDPHCPYANCGLEGVTFDPDGRRLYVGKEHSMPRIFVTSLGPDGCAVPGPYPSVVLKHFLAGIADLAWLPGEGLFVLGRRMEMRPYNMNANLMRPFVFALRVGADGLPKVNEPPFLHSDNAPDHVRRWLFDNKDAEGLWVERHPDGSWMIHLLAESGPVLRWQAWPSETAPAGAPKTGGDAPRGPGALNGTGALNVDGAAGDTASDAAGGK